MVKAIIDLARENERLKMLAMPLYEHIQELQAELEALKAQLEAAKKLSAMVSKEKDAPSRTRSVS